MISSLLTELWRLKLSNITSKFDDVISPTKVLQLIWNYRLFYLVVVITCSDFVGRDIQKYRYLQTSYTEDAIDVSLRRTPNACSQTLFSAKQERGILLTEDSTIYYIHKYDFCTCQKSMCTPLTSRDAPFKLFFAFPWWRIPIKSSMICCWSFHTC